MNMERKSLGPLGTNCYLLYNELDALIIDPGGDASEILNFFADKACSPKAILLTHAHFDHIGAVDEVRATYKIPVYLHGKEQEWLEDPKLNGSTLFTANPISTRKAEHELKEGDLKIGSFEFNVLHTPGHSPGSVCFVFKEAGVVIGGDLLFNMGVGRTDLPGGNMDQLMNSIRVKLFQLKDDTTVYPGHGVETTIGEEKRVNPFLK
ncbi:MBL fold metallo-hydrolase [Virgibacillus sp. DJP39]|uniref:MBL fold metallo-hydrolase n=1 Tax=Virgibacillus sp. DJP39 TaxID=3409790 RepID=UPI003BB6E2E7